MEDEYDDAKEHGHKKKELRLTQCTIDEYIQDLRSREKNLCSPINLNIANMKQIYLPQIEWHHYEVPPKKLKLTNSGHTVILSGKWFQERPYLTGGPFIGNYVFSQLHFHWGANDMEGSEHFVDGTQYPLEMHCVHFRSAYLTQESALHENDGVVVLVYILKLHSLPNPFLQEILDNFVIIQKANTSIKLEAKPINLILPCVINDYFMYWGNIKTSKRNHVILWVVCRTPIGISAEQVDYFRTLLDTDEEPLIRNYRYIETLQHKNVYHVNSSESKYSTLLPIPRDETVKRR